MTQRATFALVLIGCLAAIPATAATARDQASGEGVQVENMSPLRKLVPEGEIEASATQQYNNLKQEADKKGALLPASDPQVKRVRAITRQLIPLSERWNPSSKDWNWEVNVIDSPQINAFCMPGGKIGIFTGIINQLKLTDDELAIVIGHEIAHALREHGRERVAKSTLTNAGARLLGAGLSAWLGVDANLTGAAANAGASLVVLKFSRSDETEADLVGLDIVARAGFDPRAGIALWRKMGMVNKSSPPQWLSTHPAGTARIAEMQKQMPSVMPLFAKAKGVELKSLPPYKSNVKGIESVK